jgi:hypothetical protein
MIRKSLITLLALVLTCSLLGSALPAWADVADGAGGTGVPAPGALEAVEPDGAGAASDEVGAAPDEAETDETPVPPAGQDGTEQVPAPGTNEEDEGGEDGFANLPIEDEAGDDEPLAEDGSALLPLVSAPLEAGRYRIRPAVSDIRMLDIYGASKRAGGNLQIYESNNASNQFFNVTVDGQGYYTITNVGSGLVLDVTGAQAKSGTNVIQYTKNPAAKNANQRWVIEESHDSAGNKVYSIGSALGANLMLDVSGANDRNEANVQIWTRHSGAAQKFYFLPLDPGIVSERIVDNGIYTLTSALSGGFVVDIAGSSNANGIQLQLWKRNAPDTMNQMFEIMWQGDDGFYSIRPVCSAKAVDVAGGGVVATTPLLQYEKHSADNQRWALVKNGDGYTFVAKQSGLVLDAYGGRAANGTKLQLYYSHGGANQRFKLTKVDAEPLAAGVFGITPFSNASQRIDIEGASKSAGARALLWSSHGGFNQKFEVIRVAQATYAFRSLCSGLYLAAQGDAVSQEQGLNGAPRDTQKWLASYILGGVRLVNPASNKALVVSSGTLKLATPNSASSQAFKFNAVRAVEPGFYTIAAPGGRMVDVNGGSFDQKANVQIWAANGGGAQSWRVEYTSSGRATIRNAKSYLALDVVGNGTAEGTGVCQWSLNSTNNQLWEFVPAAEGRFLIRCANDTWLKVNGANQNGTSVCVTRDKANATSFAFAQATYTGISGNSELDISLGTIMRQLGSNGDVLRKCFNYVVGYRYVSGSTYPSGDWSVPFAIEMYRNGGGNCYRFAALFCWLARANGYDARVVSGQVPSRGGGWTAHGWVEIRSGGQTYICDPDAQHEIPYANFYWRTYSNPPISYRIL